jgi:hypothetical protein
MRAIPYVGVRALTGLAVRTAAVRVALGVVLVGLVAAAALAARHPHASRQPFASPKTGGIVVLDLSASITSDTYSRIHQSLQELVARGGRYGLVVFSNTAYEALPPGTPASALQPLVRYFALPASTPPGEQPTFPVNPWTETFTSGTSISLGLDLARTIELAHGGRRPAVVLISDLADDPNDVQRLTAVLGRYRSDGIPLRVIALNPAISDLEYFKRLIGTASSIIPAGLSSGPSAPVKPPATSFPTWLVVLTAVVAALLAVNELRAARLRWGGIPEEAAA